MALGELSSILSHDQGVVGILRKRLTQCCVEQILPRGIGDVIFSPNHMSYLHTGVINDNGVVVRITAVTTLHDEIPYHRGRDVERTVVTAGIRPLVRNQPKPVKITDDALFVLP